MDDTYRIKPEEFYILSCEMDLRIESHEGFIWPNPTIMRNPHNQQLGQTWLILIPTMLIGLYITNNISKKL